jgi:hypothetical protein
MVHDHDFIDSDLQDLRVLHCPTLDVSAPIIISTGNSVQAFSLSCTDKLKVTNLQIDGCCGYVVQRTQKKKNIRIVYADYRAFRIY